jgi:hypothetical protein
MDFVLDIRTLSFATGVIAFVMFLCMLHVKIRRRTYPGFTLWTWAALANGTGFVLLSFRHLLPVEGTVIVANWLIALSAVLICRGLARFASRPQYNWLDASALVLTLGIFIHFTIIEPSVNARVVFISLFLAIFYLRGTMLVVGPVARLLGQQNILLAVSSFIMGVWFLVRGMVSGIWEERIADFMTAGSWHGLTFLCFMVCNTLAMVGLISINSRRVENDLTSALQEIKSLQGIIPICSNCKKIRNDQGYWQMVEIYVREHTGAEFTHGICPDCMDRLYPEIKDNNEKPLPFAAPKCR